MSIDKSSPEQLTILDKKLSDIANDKEHCLECVHRIQRYLDSYISHPSIEVLDSIFDHYKEPSFSQTSESRRLYVICTILKTEIENNSVSFFSDNIRNSKELYDRYIYSILMIRRLILDFPDELKEEAMRCLADMNLSPYAYILILSNELFEDFEYTLHIIAEIMHDRWDTMQNTHFAMHIAECFPTENNYLCTASYCMDMQHYKLAYKYLLRIENPSPSTLELITTLKGALNE